MELTSVGDYDDAVPRVCRQTVEEQKEEEVEGTAGKRRQKKRKRSCTHRGYECCTAGREERRGEE